MDLIINLNKPKDITSQDGVTKVKKIFRAKKAGHAGTLDPMATGVLLVCLNRATRLTSFFSSLEKEYKAVMKLGISTDTQDAYGNIIETCDDISVNREQIEAVLKSFSGKTFQEPPMFSALKHKGKPLYKLARKGIEIERKPREINISLIELLDIDMPFVTFRARCSKGTYIRTLCHDMGKKLGTCAHLYELERTAIGDFHISESISPDKLIDICKGHTTNIGIHSMGDALSWLPELTVDESVSRAISHGNPLELHELSDTLKTAEAIKIKSRDNTLLSIGRYVPEKKIIKMDIVFT
ncbi:MAG: tRNA pseudouridine(55) synthase TruB [Nitrospiraceae bacterium]|nr:MAG: tRNA pseudouridine(55) synthase TruB [Nitrospiraceae bacterium]